MICSCGVCGMCMSAMCIHGSKHRRAYNFMNEEKLMDGGAIVPVFATAAATNGLNL